jgi:hypothetical protein
VGRALEHLGVEHIAAYSPQARGRSERDFHTLQDRLVKEFALAGIVTMEAADLFLRDVYIPAHNARFSVKPSQEGSAFVASLPIAYQLYLPEEWAGDAARRAQVHVPETITFQTKPEIALKQIKTALEAGTHAGVVLADAGYGVDAKFRSGLTALGLAYVVGVQSTLSVWPSGMEPLPPPAWVRRRRDCVGTASISPFRRSSWR